LGAIGSEVLGDRGSWIGDVGASSSDAEASLISMMDSFPGSDIDDDDDDDDDTDDNALRDLSLVL